MKTATKCQKQRLKLVIALFTMTLCISAISPSAYAQGNPNSSGPSDKFLLAHSSSGKILNRLKFESEALRYSAPDDLGEQALNVGEPTLNQERFWATHPGVARHIHATPALLTDPATRTTA
ncbi:MAG TPA: hypothetical protein VHS07_06920 [Candidatus Binataceae bacterium]|nr:hypothetical protein [Candidatus Binataceae bacterium]